MSGLVLKLRPHEELMINGVLVENGDRNTRLCVKSDGAYILRLRDALRPEEATTPLKRAYYIAQLAVSGQITSTEAASILKKALEERPDLDPTEALIRSIREHDFYQVMRALRTEALADRAHAVSSPECAGTRRA
ncbi:flagellar biosynthesis repressor FlbT [Hyphococcus flavus]|uniref:Flagellar biosynthesis repressor FlbT n=1 Tax=Hyphococcus flavus TaxID=1866326 RepID=A0AAE9ZDP1_9PROT|nr:flagellar biosynthesis repressor FlbT [Hyphococcus flavus]WDI32884.1 flagellar biosynthesis repressor FlbT [Hyphococcus flavus]